MSALSSPPPLRALPPRVAILEGLSIDEAQSRRDMLMLTFDRRIRYSSGRGCWRDWRAGLKTCPELPWRVDLAVPPIADWTRETIVQVIAIARNELGKRGARGRCRIAARPYSEYLVNRITVVVRVGDLRTEFLIDAGVIRFEVPLDVVATLADLAPHRDLTLAIKLARERRTKGGE